MEGELVEQLKERPLPAKAEDLSELLVESENIFFRETMLE